MWRVSRAVLAGSLLTLLTLLPLTACDGGDGGDGDRDVDGRTPPGAAPEPLAPFEPARTRVPKGFHEELCPDLRRGSPGLTIRLVVPDSYGPRTEKTGGRCFFQGTLDRDFTISPTRGGSLAAYRDDVLRPDDGSEGDDGVDDVALESEVPVFGRHRGEVLTWWSYNDGLPLDNAVLQAAGVRIDWHTKQGTSDQWADELRVVTDSVAVVRGRRSTCVVGGVTAMYATPPEVAASESYGDECYHYLRPQDSLLHHAIVDPAPRLSVDELAARRERQKHVTSVRVERGAATLLGQPADRLTVVQVRPHRTWDGPRGTWRLVTLATPDVHVTWGATPRQWRDEQAGFDTLVRTLRLSPARPSRS